MSDEMPNGTSDEMPDEQIPGPNKVTSRSSNPPIGLWRSYKFAFTLRPLAVIIPTMMVPVGIAALILGDDASRAFTLIPGGALLAHILGILLAAGGIITLAGTLRLGTFAELLGLVFVAAGSFIYAAGVFVGLGVNGIIAGAAYLAITIGCVGRVFLLLSIAHRLGQGQ